MKKIISLAVIIGIFIVQSCDKEESLQTNNIVTIRTKVQTESVLSQLDETSVTVLKSLKCLSDFKIQNYLYHLAISIRDLTKNDDFNKSILEMAKSDNMQIVELNDLDNAYPHYYDQINENLRDVIQSKSSDQQLFIGENSIESISNDLIYNGNGEDEKYEPVIFVYNSREADPNLQPIVTYGIAVDGDKYPQFDDYVYMWAIETDGSFTEYILNEEQANSIENPIFVIDNGQLSSKRFEQEYKIESDSKTEGSLKGIDWEDFHHTSYFRINHRYESSGDSDYNMVAWGLGPNGEDTEIMRNSSNNLKERLEIYSVDKDDIGITKLSSEYFSYYYSSDWFLFFQCFERDWIRSSKFLGVGSGYGKSHYFYGNLQYESEWYAWNTTTSLDRIYLPSYYYTTYTFDSSKGFQELQRSL